MAINAQLNTEIGRKIRDVIRSVDAGVITTSSSRLPITTAYQSNVEWDENGALWFRGVEANQPDQIVIKHSIKLFYSDPATSSYVSIYGDAELENVAPRQTGFWNSLTSMFSSTTVKEEVRIRKVTPTEAYLWDNDSNRMVSAFISERNERPQKVVVSCLFGEVVLAPQQSSIANVA